jgi:hypothetical protein
MAYPELTNLSCVIPLGSGSKLHDYELRYSLRSLQPEDVWLIGTCPNWFIGNHIAQGEGGITTLNIWKKLLTACNTPEISDPFLYSNDDYFFLHPFDLTANYYGNLTGNNTYKQLARHTMRMLGYNDLPQLFFDVHRPMMIHKQAFIDAYTFFEPHLCRELGLLVKSCYGNYNRLEGTLITDMKFAYWAGEPDEDIFSIGDGCLNVPFRAWCESKWPEKSEWEK